MTPLTEVEAVHGEVGVVWFPFLEVSPFSQNLLPYSMLFVYNEFCVYYLPCLWLYVCVCVWCVCVDGGHTVLTGTTEFLKKGWRTTVKSSRLS